MRALFILSVSQSRNLYKVIRRFILVSAFANSNTSVYINYFKRNMSVKIL